MPVIILNSFINQVAAFHHQTLSKELRKIQITLNVATKGMCSVCLHYDTQIKNRMCLSVSVCVCRLRPHHNSLSQFYNSVTVPLLTAQVFSVTSWISAIFCTFTPPMPFVLVRGCLLWATQSCTLNAQLDSPGAQTSLNSSGLRWCSKFIRIFFEMCLIHTRIYHI